MVPLKKILRRGDRMFSGVEQKEPTATEWETAREVVKDLRELDANFTDQQLHFVRMTVLTVLIRKRQT